MILPNFKDFPKIGRILGIDWGARRTGTAISTPDRTFVFAREQITDNRGQGTINALCEIISDEKIVGIVVGLPLHADGTDSDTTKMVRKFANDLSDIVNVPIVFIEENLTSYAAMCKRQETSLCKCSGGQARDKKQNIDSISAKIILENAIAMMKRN